MSVGTSAIFGDWAGSSLGDGGIINKLHAGAYLMAFGQNLVDLDQADPMSVDRFVQATDPALSVTAKINELTECGSAGDPTASNAEIGRLFLAKTVDQIVSKFDEALKTFYP